MTIVWKGTGTVCGQGREGVTSQAHDLGHIGLISVFAELSCLRRQKQKTTTQMTNCFKLYEAEELLLIKPIKV